MSILWKGILQSTQVSSKIFGEIYMYLPFDIFDFTTFKTDLYIDYRGVYSTSERLKLKAQLIISKIDVVTISDFDYLFNPEGTYVEKRMMTIKIEALDKLHQFIFNATNVEDDRMSGTYQSKPNDSGKFWFNKTTATTIIPPPSHKTEPCLMQ
jgi:hypothetical protein